MARHCGDHVKDARATTSKGNEARHPPAGPIRSRRKAGIAVLRGNLAPDGAGDQAFGGDTGLMQHRGRAIVFEDSADMHAKVETNRST